MVGTTGRVRTLFAGLSVAVGLLAATGGPAAAQWTVVNLHPPGAIESRAHAASGGVQSGYAVFPVGTPTVGGGTGGGRRAVKWAGTAASWTELHPAAAMTSYVNGAAGAQQVGLAQLIAGNMHASLWSGSAASWIDLHPIGGSATQSSALATDGTQQVGTTITPTVWIPINHAALWTGTAASMVELHPAGAALSGANGVAAGEQVGWAWFVDRTQAGLWHGTAASWVDLHPAGGVGFAASVARDTDGSQQVGYTMFTNSNNTRAALWRGSAASWVDLNPAGSPQSDALAVFGGRQAGSAYFGTLLVAGVWSGTAASWEPLPLPNTGSWGNSAALDIWNSASTVYVVGYARNLATQSDEAILWTRPISPPCAADVDGSGQVGLQDVFDFLALYFGNDPRADINGSGAITVQDIFDFLAAYFAGC